MSIMSAWKSYTPAGMAYNAWDKSTRSKPFSGSAAPEDISYQGITDANGNLLSQYSMAQQPRSEFESRLRDQALSTSPTLQARLQAGQSAQLAQSGMAQGLSQAAQSGGASTGARERLARQAMLQGALGRQNAFSQGELQKQQLQQAFAQQAAQERGHDVQSSISDRMNQQQFNLDQYKAKLAQWAGSQEAAQQEHLARTTGGFGGRGGFLGLGF